MGALQDLRPYLDMIPPLMADAIEARIDGVPQKALANLLGLKQSTVSQSARAGIRRIQWLRCRPKVTRLQALQDILPLLASKWMARPIVYWIWSVYSLTAALEATIGRVEHPWPRRPGAGREHQARVSEVVREVLAVHGTERLRDIISWRRRAGFCLRGQVTSSPPVRERPLFWLPLQPEEIPCLLSLHRTHGWGALRMSHLYGVAPSVLHAVLRTFSVSRASGDRPKGREVKEEARRRHDDGLSWREIGREMGVSHTTARHWALGRPSKKQRRKAAP